MTEPREIICVCYGNICRSPMAEMLLRRALDTRFGAGAFVVTSAGINAQNGASAEKKVLVAMESRGIDATSHRSARLTDERAERAWRIYCMEEYQANWVRGMVSDKDKVRVLGEEVPDPLGSSQRKFEAVARQLEKLLPAEVEDIARSLASEQA